MQKIYRLILLLSLFFIPIVFIFPTNSTTNYSLVSGMLLSSENGDHDHDDHEEHEEHEGHEGEIWHTLGPVMTGLFSVSIFFILIQRYIINKQKIVKIQKNKTK